MRLFFLTKLLAERVFTEKEADTLPERYKLTVAKRTA